VIKYILFNVVALVFVANVYADFSPDVIIAGTVFKFDATSVFLKNAQGVWRIPRLVVMEDFNLKPDQKIAVQVERTKAKLQAH
jgi:hypothetical protein